MVFAVAGGNAGTWLDCSVMSTTIRNFPNDRGQVVGILKAFLALSGSLLSLIFTVFFDGDPASFILFLAIAPPLLVAILSVFINRVPEELTEMKESKKTNARRFAQIYLVIAILSLSVCITALLGAWHEIQDEGRKIAMVWLLISLAALLFIPLTAGPLIFPRRRNAVALEVESPIDDEDQEEAGPLLPQTQPAADEETDSVDLEPPQTTSAALKTISFWLVALQMGVGIGTGLSLINNLAGIVKLLGGQSGGQVGACVSLFSVANASGRLLFGYLSELAMARGSSRMIVLLIVSSLSFIFALLMSTIATASDLILLSFIGGLAFGGHWSVVPAILSDLYGLSLFPTLYTLVQLAPALGGYLLSTCIVGNIGYGSDSWEYIALLNLLSLYGSWWMSNTSRAQRLTE